MRVRTALPMLVAAGIAVSGCAHSSTYDSSAFRSAVEAENGHPVADWPTFEKLSHQVCETSDDSFALRTSVEADQGTLPTFRIIVKFVCPDRSDDIDKILNANAEVDRACDIPAVARTERQQRLAEAMGCS